MEKKGTPSTAEQQEDTSTQEDLFSDSQKKSNSPQSTSSKQKMPFFTYSNVFDHVWLWLGLACFLAWVNCLLCFEGVLRDEVEEAGGLVHDPLFLGATLTASIMLIVCSICSDRIGAMLDSFLHKKHPVVISSALLGAVCSGAAVLLLPSALYLPPFASCLLGVGIGICIAVLTITWGSRLSSFDLRDILLVVCAAFCLQWIPFLILGLLDNSAKAIVTIVLLAVSAFCLLRTSDPEGATQHANAPNTSSKTLPRIGLAMFCFALLIQFTWTFFITMTPAYLNVNSFIWVFLAVLLATAFLIALSLGFMEKQQSYRIDIIYKVAFFFCACAVCVLGIAAQHLFASYIVVYIAYSFVIPTMWMLALGTVFMSKTPPAKVFSTVFGVQYLGFFLGFLLAQIIQNIFGRGEGALIAPYATLLMVTILLLVYIVILPERSLLALSPRIFGLSRESIDKRCSDLGEQYGLSKRELEVFSLFARGRSLKYIEKTLYISKNTVASHRKNIYRKLEIHSQQELLSLVEGVHRSADGPSSTSP